MAKKDEKNQQDNTEETQQGTSPSDANKDTSSAPGSPAAYETGGQPPKPDEEE
jgi:hypothetical protein